SGSLSTTIEIESSDPETPLITVPLTGSSNGQTGVGPSLGGHFAVELAGPNPAAGRARVALVLPSRAFAEVAVFDLRGSRVRDLTRGSREAGRHPIEWDGKDEAGN